MSIDDIPTDWSLPILRSVSLLNPTRKDWPTDPLVSFFEMSHVSKEGRMSNGVSGNMSSFSSGFTPFRNGDVILAKITPCFENGKGAFVENMPSGYGLGSTEFHVVRTGADLDARFFFYLSISYWFRKNGERNMTGSAGQKRVPTDWLKTLKIPLPPLPEQKKIAEILGACDEAIEAQERLIAQKQQRKKGLMQQLLTGKTRFPKFAGKPWREVRLGEVGNILKGKGISKKDCGSKGTFRAIRYAQIYTKHHIVAEDFDTFISEEVASQSLLLFNGDIVFACSGESAEEIGKSAVYLKNVPCYASGDTLILRQKTEDSLFLAYLLNSGTARCALNRLGKGNSVVHIYKRDLESLLLKIPERKEQTAISSVLSACDEEIALQQTKLKQLKQQKKGLMQLLLTGKVRVKI